MLHRSNAEHCLWKLSHSPGTVPEQSWHPGASQGQHRRLWDLARRTFGSAPLLAAALHTSVARLGSGFTNRGPAWLKPSQLAL